MDPKGFFGLAAFLLLVAVAQLGIIGTSVWFTASYPQLASRIRTIYATRGGRCTVVGAIDLVLSAIVFAILANIGPLKLFALLWAIFVISTAVIALATAYWDIGGRITSDRVDTSTTRAVLTGGIVTACAFMAPVFGQVLFIATLCRGIGAVVLGFVVSDAAERSRVSPE
jgi:hypothetical protein